MARHLPRQAGTGWPLPDQLRTTPFLHALRERTVDVRTRMAGSDPSVCFCNRQRLAGAAVQCPFDAALKADWVRPQFGRGDQRYSEYPELSIEAWHRRRGLWID